MTSDASTGRAAPRSGLAGGGRIHIGSRRWLLLVWTVLPLLCATACGSAPATSSPGASPLPVPSSGAAAPESSPAAPAITVTSTAFPAGGRLPTRFTCDGAGTAPPLAFSGIPAAALSVAVVVDDPDAPHGTYTHWIVAGLPATTTAIDGEALPEGAVQAMTSAGSTGYTPPCPPSGTHRYRFTVVALSVARPFDNGAGTAEARAAIDHATIASGTLIARYSRT